MLALWRRCIGVVLATSCVGVVFAVCFFGGRLDGSIREPQILSAIVWPRSYLFLATPVGSAQ